MAERRKKKKRGGLFLLLGLLMIGGALGLTAYNKWDSDRAGKASEDVLETLNDEMEDYHEEIEEWKEENGVEDEEIPLDITHALLGQDENLAMPGMEVDGYIYIGVLSIPSLSIELPIMGDWDMEWLKTSPCRYSGSYYQDNLVIAGHNYRRHFSPIKWIALGTDVYFKNVEGLSYHYVVSNLETIEPSAVEDMITADDWDLTLFTCTTGGASRCAVRCTRVEDSGV